MPSYAPGYFNMAYDPHAMPGRPMGHMAAASQRFTPLRCVHGKCIQTRTVWNYCQGLQFTLAACVLPAAYLTPVGQLAGSCFCWAGSCHLDAWTWYIYLKASKCTPVPKA